MTDCPACETALRELRKTYGIIVTIPHTEIRERHYTRESTICAAGHVVETNILRRVVSHSEHHLALERELARLLESEGT